MGNGAPQARPREKMKEMGARRRRAPLFGAAGAEKGGNWGRAAGAPPNFSAPQAPKKGVWGVFLRVIFKKKLCIFSKNICFCAKNIFSLVKENDFFGTTSFGGLLLL